MVLLLLTVVAFALVVLVMSVGVLLSGKCLRGSCGGPDILGPDGKSLACATCPHRKLAERGRGAERRGSASASEAA
jgi:hypothetical protein